LTNHQQEAKDAPKEAIKREEIRGRRRRPE